jgi:hypothetical protein
MTERNWGSPYEMWINFGFHQQTYLIVTFGPIDLGMEIFAIFHAVDL